MDGIVVHELGALWLRFVDVHLGDDVDYRQLNPLFALFIAPRLRGKASIERRSKQNINKIT